MKKNLISPIFLFVIIPTICILFWIISSLIAFGKPYLVMEYDHSFGNLQSWQTTELLQGQKITGNFIARQNNLGIVDVRFFNSGRISSDQVEFRIKQVGSPSWYYQYHYKVDQFQPNDYFTFGFPTIADAKGKQYYFEVQSLHGQHLNAIALSKYAPPFASVYEVSRSDLKKQPLLAIEFGISKVTHLFHNYAQFHDSIIFLFPLFLYLIILFFFSSIAKQYVSRIKQSRIIQRNRSIRKMIKYLPYVLLLCFFTFAFWDILVLHIDYIEVIILFYICWFILTRLLMIDSSISLLIAFFFLIFTLFSSRQLIQSDESATWFDVFFYVGIVQIVFDTFSQRKNLRGLPFLQKLGQQNYLSFSFLQKHWKISTILAVIVLAIISYGRAVDFNFWYDDWGTLFLLLYRSQAYVNWVFSIRHPGEAFIHMPEVYLFGPSHLLVQAYGIVLKVVVSLTTGLVLYGITKSRKIFAITSVLSASYFGGIEAYYFFAARLSDYLIILLNLFLYFYISAEDGKHKKKLFASLCFFAFSMFLEPDRIFFLIPVILIWQFASQYVKKKLWSTQYLLLATSFIFTSFVGLFVTPAGKGLIVPTHSTNSSGGYIGLVKQYVLHNTWYVLQVFFGSIGNLVNAFSQPTIHYYGNFSYFMYYYAAHTQNVIIGIIFIAVGLFIPLYLIGKRKKEGSILLLCILLMLFLYIPSWIAQLVEDPLRFVFSVEVFHRYIAMSAIVFIMLIAYLLSLVPKKQHAAVHLIILILLMINLFVSFHIVEGEYALRGYAVSQPLFDKQNADIPANVKKAFFWVESSTHVPLIINRFLGSNYGINAFLLRRHIGDIESVYMVSTSNADAIFCKNDYVVPVPEPLWKIPNRKKQPNSIGDIYGWDMVTPYKLVNISNVVRIKIVGAASCLHKVQDIDMMNGITLAATATIDSLYKDPRQAIAFYWNLPNAPVKKVTSDITLYAVGHTTIAEQKFLTNEKDLSQHSFGTALFISKQANPVSARISQEVCTDSCISKEVEVSL